MSPPTWAMWCSPKTVRRKLRANGKGSGAFASTTSGYVFKCRKIDVPVKRITEMLNRLRLPVSPYLPRRFESLVGSNCGQPQIADLSAILRAERADDGLGLPVDDRQQHASGPVRYPAPLLPFLQCAYIETETIGELLPTQIQTLSNRKDSAGGGIVHDSAGQRRVATHVGEYFFQRRLDLAPCVSSLCGHRSS